MVDLVPTGRKCNSFGPRRRIHVFRLFLDDLWIKSLQTAAFDAAVLDEQQQRKQNRKGATEERSGGVSMQRHSPATCQLRSHQTLLFPIELLYGTAHTYFPHAGQVSYHCSNDLRPQQYILIRPEKHFHTVLHFTAEI